VRRTTDNVRNYIHHLIYSLPYTTQLGKNEQTTGTYTMARLTTCGSSCKRSVSTLYHPPNFKVEIRTRQNSQHRIDPRIEGNLGPTWGLGDVPCGGGILSTHAYVRISISHCSRMQSSPMTNSTPSSRTGVDLRRQVRRTPVHLDIRPENDASHDWERSRFKIGSRLMRGGRSPLKSLAQFRMPRLPLTTPRFLRV
jgi:hypothetical protein